MLTEPNVFLGLFGVSFGLGGVSFGLAIGLANFDRKMTIFDVDSFCNEKLMFQTNFGNNWIGHYIRRKIVRP